MRQILQGVLTLPICVLQPQVEQLQLVPLMQPQFTCAKPGFELSVASSAVVWTRWMQATPYAAPPKLKQDRWNHGV